MILVQCLRTNHSECLIGVLGWEQNEEGKKQFPLSLSLPTLQFQSGCFILVHPAQSHWAMCDHDSFSEMGMTVVSALYRAIVNYLAFSVYPVPF